MVESQGGESSRVLDPSERASEVLFGLIMVLSFTCSISVATAGREDLKEVLVGAIGCNFAWGIVDAVMYLLARRIERARSLATARAVRACATAEEGQRVLAQALPEPLPQLFDAAALESARKKLLALPDLPKRSRFSSSDWRGAFGVFLLVFLSTFPVVVPFLVFSPLQTALRISNAVAIVMLYAAGHLLGRYAGLSPARTGWSMVAIGVCLVGITMALGG